MEILDKLYHQLEDEDIDKIMNGRGFSLSSHSESGDARYYIKDIDGVSIVAEVNLKYLGGLLQTSEMMLSFRTLKMFLKIETPFFELFHLQGKKFHDVIVYYSKLCKENPPF